LAELPSWEVGTMTPDGKTMDGYRPLMYDHVGEMIETLRYSAMEAIKSLKLPNGKYDKNWKMEQGGETLMEMPKYRMLRGMVVN